MMVRTGQARFEDPTWVHVDEIASYMQEIYQYCISARLNAPEAAQAAARKGMTTLVTVFVVAVALCAMVYYPSIIRNLNVSIKANRALLLLMPEDVVTSVKVWRPSGQ
jgi:hypothetical protein